MSKKHYVIWKGAQTGVFDTWATVKSLTAGSKDAQYMGFASKAEADAAFKSTYTKALMKRSLEKSGGPRNSSPPTNATNSSSENASTVKKQTKKSSLTPENNADFNIYCDGACSPNPGKSGTGMAVYEKDTLAQLWYGLHQKMGTNNTAELNGMLEAFRFAKPLIAQNKSVQVLSDSKYSIDCITKWAKGWQAKGWKRGKNEEIKNLAIIQECFSLYQAMADKIIITHVKGHANIEGNELSDRMAVLARMKAEQGFVQYTDSINIQDILAMPSG
ncbi:ribonuclease H1 domain-containing protein [Algibacillus agarilyticus]|uniref:ribonuclease H1 domain-containing protein n=1 Tax=Algibacillus agarilyticus TaxID=2234133 RepID=UPI000DD027CF|nr:ribonuclease H family protein [Algibacillus agarilyticus]